MTIIPGDLDDPRVCGLLEHHAKTARAATAPGSAHAVTLEGLKTPGITLWAAWDGDLLLGVGALRRLSDDHGEIKSMYTTLDRRRRGVGSAMLLHIIDTARAMGMSRLSLETGSWEISCRHASCIRGTASLTAHRLGSTSLIRTVYSCVGSYVDNVPSEASYRGPRPTLMRPRRVKGSSAAA